jgi:hypothetical protein
MRNFIIEDMATDEKVTIASLSDMTLKDAQKAIAAYDKLRLNRGRPRRARYADNAERLETAYKIGRISKSTYYRRLKQLED